MTEIVEVMTESGTVVEVTTGLVGPVGRSAYRVAQDAGFAGTEAEWLSSLVGPVGRSAYGVAQDAGFPGTEAEWQESLVGPPGRSAYRVALDAGFVGTEAEWLESLNARPAFVDYVGFEAPTADSGATTSLLFDDDGRALVVWRDAAVAADAGVDMYMSRAFWDRAAPEIGQIVDSVLATPIQTVHGAGLYEVVTDAAGQALIVWRTEASESDSGLDAYMSRAFWDRGAAKMRSSVSTTALHAITGTGQSLLVGGDFAGSGLAAPALLARALPGTTLMLAGMVRGDGVPVDTVAGPGSPGYNEAVPATGLTTAAVGSTVTSVWPLAAAISLYRMEAGLPLVPIVTQAHGISGIPIEDIDDDPTTGTGSLTVWNNLRYFYQQMVAVAAAQGKSLYVPWHQWVHGTSAKSYPAGAYLTQLWQFTADMRALLASIGALGPATLLVSQSGGDANTNQPGEDWHVCDEQLQFCEMGGGVLTTPEYAYQIADNNVHPDAVWTVQSAEVQARAAVETEAGRPWTIRRPKPSLIGSTLILDYDSLRPGEYLAAHDPARYGGQGIDGWLGYEVEGATITDLAVRGRTVALTCSAPPTAVRYALQRQDCTGFAGNKWSAHRGLLRTSDVWPSKLLPGTMLYRWTNSFRIAF